MLVFWLLELVFQLSSLKVVWPPKCSARPSFRAPTSGNLSCHDSLDQYHTVARIKTWYSFRTGFATSSTYSVATVTCHLFSSQLSPLAACLTISHNCYIGTYAWLLYVLCNSNDIHNAACATVEKCKWLFIWDWLCSLDLRYGNN